jgi:hypothetical protein
MRKLIVFNHVSLDGYFVDGAGDMSWAKADHQDAEWDAFVRNRRSFNGTRMTRMERIHADLF